ncbi:gluconokinase [Knoellia sp. LjRoot47]|uniref:gluconokinase n=1 Tax=Knoellia sp. LjRoot47 TaxID=3342330 RepID=UPI003ECFC5FE
MSARSTRHVVVMGVSGSGKTTVAQGVADATGFEFAEADAFHSPENIATMERGIALTDADRWPWLTALAEWMTARSAAGASTIITCSALKRTYRDVLRDGAPSVTFVHLDGPAEVIRERLSVREGHFMPASLLQSQIDTLEPLGDDEEGVVLDLRRSPDELIRDAVDWLEHDG